jgi:hypothetical protein
MRTWVLLAMLLTGLLSVSNLYAWGPEGHQTVGMIAEARLTPEAKAKIGELLEGKALSDLSVVVWADLLAPKSTKPWHYVDIPLDENAYVPERDGHEGNNVIEKTVEMAALLKDKSKPIEERQRALKYLIHFVGDMHQPLHAAERKNDDGKPDKGGNLVQVRLPGAAVRVEVVPATVPATMPATMPATSPAADGAVRLHIAWDKDLVVGAMGGEGVEVFAGGLGKSVKEEDAKVWTKGVGGELSKEVVIGWVLESHKVAQETVYPGVPSDGSVKTLDKAYVEKSEKAIKEQLTKAGVRLAAVLNEQFK